MVKKAIINFCYKAVEEKMLKIYATIMTTIFLAIWVPTMIIALTNVFKLLISNCYLAFAMSQAILIDLSQCHQCPVVNQALL